MIGTTLEKYEILEEVGQGGMATVYRARDLRLGREVALKVLHPHLARQEEARRRFRREAQAVARLRHPAILEIYDYSGEEVPTAYIATEFIRGESLRDHLERRAPELPEVGMMIAVQLLGALQHAHENGVIHRDVKPENVLIGHDGGIKLADFGIAHLADGQGMTVTGALLGSPAHMSPEQIQGAELTPAADLFSLGTLLYRTVTGRLPFTAPNPQALFRKILEADRVPAQQLAPRVSDRLQRIIDCALAPEPAARFASAAAMAAELRLELASVGLVDLPAELSRYLGDPAGYEAALQPRILERLIQQAGEAAALRQRARALSLYNRALAFAPEEQRVLAAVASLGRLDRGRRLLRYGGLAAGLALGVVGLLILLHEPAPPAPSPPDRAAPRTDLRSSSPPGTSPAAPLPGAGSAADRATTPATTAAGAAPTAGPAPTPTPGTGSLPGPATPTAAAPPVPRPSPGDQATSPGPPPALPPRPAPGPEPSSAGSPPPPRPPEPRADPNRRLGFRVSTRPWTLLKIDGRQAGEPKMHHLVELGLGEHQISLENPGCKTIQFRIRVTPATASLPDRQFNLQWWPAILRIDGPPGAVAYVEQDGQKRILGDATAGTRHELAVTSSENQAVLEVKAADGITRLLRRTIRLAPKQELLIPVARTVAQP